MIELKHTLLPADAQAILKAASNIDGATHPKFKSKNRDAAIDEAIKTVRAKYPGLFYEAWELRDNEHKHERQKARMML